LTAWKVSGTELLSGTVNINTTSPHVWRSLFETYNAALGVTQMSPATVATAGTNLANAFAGTASGKAMNAPFTSVAAFGSSALLASVLPATVSPDDFMSAIGGLLSVRSDTFRIRAYGESVNSVDGAIESIAYCEALMQRMTDTASTGAGRRIITSTFRWLGPEDI
jgi:hypothetical protein